MLELNKIYCMDYPRELGMPRTNAKGAVNILIAMLQKRNVPYNDESIIGVTKDVDGNMRNVSDFWGSGKVADTLKKMYPLIDRSVKKQPHDPIGEIIRNQTDMGMKLYNGSEIKFQQLDNENPIVIDKITKGLQAKKLIQASRNLERVKNMEKDIIELDKIYNMDCLEGMKQIPDGTIDAVICDLPYGTTACAWDVVIPFEPLWAEYKRICKPTAAIVLFSQQPFTSALVMSNPQMFRYEWIWEKKKGTGILNSHHAPLKIHENICVFSRAAASPSSQNPMQYNPQYTKDRPYIRNGGNNGSLYGSTRQLTVINEGVRFPTDIIKFDRDSDGFHPTQKPVDLLRYLVLTYTNEGDTVLDNCSGSKTTAIAAYREKRHFICFEKDPIYWEKSVKRLKNEMIQITLF